LLQESKIRRRQNLAKVDSDTSLLLRGSVAPGANITGLSIMDVELGPKRLELRHELVPKATNLAALINPTDRSRAAAISGNMQAAARTLGLELKVLHASTDGDFDTVFDRQDIGPYSSPIVVRPRRRGAGIARDVRSCKRFAARVVRDLGMRAVLAARDMAVRISPCLTRPLVCANH
jgi:hypothetical protein